MMRLQAGLQTGLLLGCLYLMSATGCTTKANAQRQARLAFLEGQQQAQVSMMEARRTTVRIVGNVRNAEIAWSDGLTLAQAVAEADYQGAGTPREILIIRQRERFIVDPNTLLNGRDWPLEPGDTVEIHPQ